MILRVQQLLIELIFLEKVSVSSLIGVHWINFSVNPLFFVILYVTLPWISLTCGLKSL